MYCTECGEENVDGVRFCIECGAPMIDENSQQIKPDPLSGNITPHDHAASLLDKSPQETNTTYSLAPVDNESGYLEAYDEEEPPIPESAINHPIYHQIKKYIVYFIAACFLYSLFWTVTVEGSGDESRSFMDKGKNTVSGAIRFSGFQLLMGSIPNYSFTETRHGHSMKSETNDDIKYDKLTDSQRQMLRTPLFFRMPYYFLIIGLGLYAFGVYGNTDARKRFVIGSIGKVVAFISAAALVWVFNDFENFGERLQKLYMIQGKEVAIDIDSYGSMGLWGLIIAMGFLVLDYMMLNLGGLTSRLQQIKFKNIENVQI